MREDRKMKYRECDISYSITEDNNEYSATGCITINAEDVLDKTICLDQSQSSFDLAEQAIIKKCKEWIDHQIDSGKFTPKNKS